MKHSLGRVLLVVFFVAGAIAVAVFLRPATPSHLSSRAAVDAERPLPLWVKEGGSGSSLDAPASEEEGPSGARQALSLWGAQRAYPHATMPPAAYGRAVQQAQAMRERRDTALTRATAPWEEIGPANVGGRTLSLAVHPTNPNILFAGSASGGLWKTTVGGGGADAWDQVDIGEPVLGVSTIAIDPADPNVMYIGTGEAYDYEDSMGGEVIRVTRGSYGMGIFKTTDGGATWSKSLDWTYQQSKGVWMVQIHPTDSDTLYAATTDGIYKTTDAGATWNLVHSVIMGMDVRIHPTTPDTVFAAHGNFSSTGRGIYRSTNAGASWTKLTSGLPSTWSGKCQLAIAPTSPNIVFASIANESAGRGLYKSTDTGNSWSRVNSTDYPAYQGWYSHYVVVSPFNANTLFVGGIEIWRSTNGGSSLSQKSSWYDVYMGTSPPEGPIGGPNYAHADHHFAIWHPTDPNTVFFASDGGVFRSTDLGENFESLIGGYQTSQFYNGFASSVDNADFAMGGLQDNFTVIYEGTEAWRRVIGGDGSWNAINPLDYHTLFGSYYYLNIWRSRDAGDNWSVVSPPDQSGDYSAFVAPYVLCPGQPTTLYAGRSRVYRSNNEGSSWFATNGGAVLSSGNPVLVLDVSATSPDTAYAATAPISGRSRVFTTRNGGTSWIEITGSLPDRYPGDLAVDPNDAQHVYVTFLGFGVSHVFKSVNGGDTWTDISGGLPDIPTSAVAVDPNHPEVVYVGTDLGVYISVDGGSNWDTFTDGMPQGMVNDLDIDGPRERIRAATHGNGAYERDLYDPDACGETASCAWYCGSGANTACDGFVVTAPPVLGGNFLASVSHPCGGLGIAALAAFSTASPGSSTPWGELLVDITDPNGELLGLPSDMGTPSQFDIPVPDNPALCGFPLYIQAFAVSPIVLHCAWDCLVGS